jgi:hypothetical protein
LRRLGSIATPTLATHHIIGIAQGSELHRKFKVIPESDESIELYRDTPRFITIIGLQLGHCEELPCVDDFLNQLNSRYDRNRGSSNSPPAT